MKTSDVTKYCTRARIWTDFFLDRERQRAFVNVVMNCRFCKMQGISCKAEEMFVS